MAEALYRKYRPRVFSDVVGQDAIERTLKNAISADKVSHAYLFCGPRGTGKTTTARLLAKALLCQEGPTPEPDGTCEDCTLIAEGRHPDVYELDAASRTGVENVREEIIGRVSFAPVRGRSKIYIIDEVHMLSTAAFNALLKTLEEPPAHVVFVLCTTDPQKVPETILSRCQRFDFRRISVESIVLRLISICVAEGVEFDAEALDLIAQRADGGMRNALTALEQLIAFGEGTVTMAGAESMLGAMDTTALSEFVSAIGKRDVAACFRWTADYVDSGADLAQFTRDLAQHVRDMYVISLGADEVVDLSDAMRRVIDEELVNFGPDRLARLLGVLGDLSRQLKTSTNPRLTFEVALTRMAVPESDLTLEGLAERIERLERAQQAQVGSLETPRPQSRGAVEPAATEPRHSEESVESAPATIVPPPDFEAVTAAAAIGAKPEEKPAPTPVETARTATDEGMREAALQRLWQATMSALEATSKAYAVLFMNATVTSVDADGALIIEFPAENSFAFKAVQGADAQAALTEALRSAGSDRSYRFVQAKAGKPSPSQASSPATPVEPPQPRAPKPEPVAPTPQPAVAEPEPQPVATSPTPQSEAPSAAVDDEVPLDVYEAEGYDFGAANEDVHPVEDAMRRDTPAPSAVAREEQRPRSNEPEAADLDEWLVAGFGEGLRFEELPPS